jgi:hypothetical protein
MPATALGAVKVEQAGRTSDEAAVPHYPCHFARPHGAW